ncbi:hypothetical protein TB2_012632 [Malus domestica]
MIICSKIEEALLSESREPDSHHDCFLKNQRGTALRISKARLPTGLLSQKIEKAPFSESREPNPQQDLLFENRKGTALQTSKARFPWIKLVSNLHTQHQLSKYHRQLFQSALTKLKHVNLAAPTTLL